MSRRRGGGHADGHMDEKWAIPYADLVTLLLGFFVILYATADTNSEKFEALAVGLAEAFNVGVREGAAGESTIFDGGSGLVPSGAPLNSLIDQDLEFVRRSIEQQAALQGALGKIVVTREQDRIVIRLADNLVFPSASADLRPDALPLLSIVANTVNELDNEVRVEGHTDNVPLTTERYASNWELSSARATAVLRYLVEAGAVDPQRTFAAGYGEFRPVAENLTPEGRALNRRADIVLLYPVTRIDVSPTSSNQGDAPAGATPAGGQ